MVVVDRLRSEPLVPTSPSRQKVELESVMRNHEAVPPAAALFVVMEFKVRTPPDADGAKVALQVSCASKVVAVPPVAGRVPL